jgi:hypothetical protein
MISLNTRSFTDAWATLTVLMRRSSRPVHTARWQGSDISQRPEARMRELLNVIVEVPLDGEESLDHWRTDVRPNLPWADDHFERERVGGQPLNPGKEWANWPFALRADKFRDAGERFNHTYMERLWPKYARRTDDGALPAAVDGRLRRYPETDPRPKFGVAWHYGDLEDLVDLLAKEPDTRQAWIPLFFPEDTGVGDGGRKPCTLGYQVIVRDGAAHIYYPLRSCDLRRHWRDDAYMAVRLLLWIVDRCRERNAVAWSTIGPGTIVMHHTSLHCFENDWLALDRGETW